MDKKLRLTLMSERGKNALNPCDTYITSGLGCFSHKGRTSVARGSFHDKRKPVTSENRDFPKKQASRRRQNVPHQACAPLDCSRAQRLLVAPKTGGSQTTETNKFLSEARRTFDEEDAEEWEHTRRRGGKCWEWGHFGAQET